jgi:hypothetical protein
MRPTPFLLLLAAAACLPTVHGAHYRPAVAGAPTKYHGKECGGAHGAGEVMEAHGPSGARLYATLLADDGRLHGRLGLFAPGGVRITVVDDSLAVARVEGGDRTVPLPVVRLDSVQVDNWPDHVPSGNAGAPSRWGPRVPFTSAFEGRGGGTMTWINFDAGTATPRPHRVVVAVPATTVAGAPWAPGTVTFAYRRMAAGIAPFNC